MDDQMAVIDNAQTPEELEQLLTAAPEEATAPEPKSDDSGEQAQEPTLEDRLAKLEELNQRFEKQLKDKDDFINQRNAEVGLLRKQLRDKQKAELAPELTNDEILENPKAAIEKAIERAKAKEKLDAEEQQAAFHEAKKQTQELLTRMLPDFDDSKAAILEVMQSDGVPGEMVKQFEADPVGMLHPSVIFQLAKRAELFKEVQTLKAQLAEAEKRPAKMADNISKYAGAKSPTAKAPAVTKKSTKLEGLTEADIDNMTLEQLNELQKELI